MSSSLNNTKTNGAARPTVGRTLRELFEATPLAVAITALRGSRRVPAPSRRAAAGIAGGRMRHASSPIES